MGISQPVSTLGVFATILDLAGIAAPPTLQVGSLAPLATGAAGSGGPILSELHDASEMQGGDGVDLVRRHENGDALVVEFVEKVQDIVPRLDVHA